MSASGFSSRQRRLILVMVLTVVIVFGLLTGFLITSLQRMAPAPTASTIPVATPSPSPSPSPPPPPTSTPMRSDGLWPKVQAARLFDQIAHQVEVERALRPLSEVTLSILNEREMEETLRTLQTDPHQELTQTPYAALGLISTASTCRWTLVPPAIYSARHGQLYLNLEHPQDHPDTQAILVHSYVHALQDQHFDLQGMVQRAHTTDERLALQALIEGDAIVATGLYSGEDPSTAAGEGLTELIVQAEMPECGDASGRDGALAALHRFPYHESQLFVSTLRERGGWKAVDDAYADPPRSTEEILHPSRYANPEDFEDESRRPVTVIVPDLTAALQDEWALVLTDTLGEFIIRLYVGRNEDEASASSVSRGWGGDTFGVWERQDGARLSVWRSIWDTVTEAKEFEQSLTRLIPQEHSPVRPIYGVRGLGGYWWDTKTGAIHLRRTGRHVLLVQAPDRKTLFLVSGELP